MTRRQAGGAHIVVSRRAPAWSVDAVRRTSARLALLWCLVAMLGVPLALRSGWQPVTAALQLGVAGCGLVAVQAFVRKASVRWAVLMLAVLHVTTVLTGVAAAHELRPDAAHQIVSWLNSGVGSALALTYGAWWGVAVFTLNVTAGLVAESAAGGNLAGGIDSAVGPFSYVLGAGLVRWAALRGEAATERALQATEAAESALQVAEQRWEAARAVQRELHDTVLATLTMLAHRGTGVPAEILARACARDAERLRSGDLTDPGTSGNMSAPLGRPEPPGVPGSTGVPESPGVLDLTGVLDLADVVRVVEEVRATGFDVRVHVADDGLGPRTARLAVSVGNALRQALRECLENARRHSGVRAADVTVVADGDWASVIVLDEGWGFDPGSVPRDRLGLRDSVSSRLADVGGSARVWSGHDLGTSILLRVPTADRLADAEPCLPKGAP